MPVPPPTPLARRVGYSEPLPAVSPTYLHFGKDESTLRSELNAEMAAYEAIRVELLRARNPSSYPHTRALQDIVRPAGLEIVATVMQRRAVETGGETGADHVERRMERAAFEVEVGDEEDVVGGLRSRT